MKYVDTVIEPGEILRYRTTISRIIYRGPASISIITAWILFQINNWGDPRNDALAAIAVLFCAVLFLRAWVRRWTTEIAVTDRRIIYKSRILKLTKYFLMLWTEELNMEALESVGIYQPFWGQWFDYGYVIARGSGGSWAGEDELVDSPLALRATMTRAGGAGSLFIQEGSVTQPGASHA